MFISGLYKDIEFTLHEGNYTIEECLDLINMSNKKHILKETACNRILEKNSKKTNDIQNIFFQPKYLNNINDGLIENLDEYSKLMVVVITENVQLFHPDTNYFYEIPIRDNLIQDLELEMIDTMFEDNKEYLFHKINKPIVPYAKLSIEGVEYL